MKIHEFQAKQVFRKLGIAVLDSHVAKSPEEAKKAFEDLGGSIAVVKAQIHAGGRGKGTFKENPEQRGVQLVKSADEAAAVAQAMLGNTLVTIQTGEEGKTVNQVLVEAGCDIFLMPSKYEPCGLNQFYSLRYGSVPVVRETGGLADSVTDFSAAGGDGSANGFSFLGLRSDQLNDTLSRAIDLWNDDPAAWNSLVETGMNQDWSWASSAEKYMQLYRQTIARRNQIETP